MSDLTQDALKKHLYYDKESGVFTRRVATARRSKVGDVAGGLNVEGYRYIGLLGRAYKANRLAWLYEFGCWPSGVVDHINGNKADDRICNLRDCTNAENSQNRRKPKGAYKTSRGYTSFVTVGGERHYLGYFNSAEDARAAYLSAKAELHPFSSRQTLG